MKKNYTNWREEEVGRPGASVRSDRATQTARAHTRAIQSAHSPVATRGATARHAEADGPKANASTVGIGGFWHKVPSD